MASSQLFDTSSALPAEYAVFTKTGDFDDYETIVDSSGYATVKCSVDLVVTPENKEDVQNIFDSVFYGVWGLRLSNIPASSTDIVEEFEVFSGDLYTYISPIDYDDQVVREDVKDLADQIFVVDTGIATEEVYQGFRVSMDFYDKYEESDWLNIALGVEGPSSNLLVDGMLLSQYASWKSSQDISGSVYTTLVCNQYIGFESSTTTEVLTYVGAPILTDADVGSMTYTQWASANSQYLVTDGGY